MRAKRLEGIELQGQDNNVEKREAPHPGTGQNHTATQFNAEAGLQELSHPSLDSRNE
jgi:hypothetical protein